MTAYAMPTIGDVIAGKYRLEKVAGEGGMGVVYAAEHLVLKQRVAVKVLLPEAAASDAVVERFSREAQAAARIQSEHVARVLDAGSLASGAPFLVMEFLEGCDLEELLKLQGTLSPAEVADFLLQALEGLAHAHAVGIVHRDLKPANLFLACRPDGTNVIKVLDFGISKAMTATPEEKKLTGQAVLGSPVYMSPEQLRNAKSIDGRADLWSVGVVAYELLSGKTPFDGDGVGEIFAAILEQEAVPLHVREPRVPVDLSEIIARCLRREPHERWPDAATLGRALVPYGTGAFTPLVERAEQVLARSKLLSVQKTPLETRRVVEAIEAAALRARTGILTAPPPLPPRAKRRVPRQVTLAAGALAAAVVTTAVASFALRASPEVAATAARSSMPTLSVSAPAPSPAPTEVVMDLPVSAQVPASATAPRPRAPAKPSATSKTARPKFLNSRE